MQCSRDEEYRVRMLAGQLGATICDSLRVTILIKISAWISAAFLKTEEVRLSAKDKVEALKKVSEVERFLESDLSLVTGLLKGGTDVAQSMLLTVTSLVEVIHQSA